MDGADIFRHVLTRATTVVKQVRDDHFANPTPDSEWNVRDLVTHMLSNLSTVEDILAGNSGESTKDVEDSDIMEDSATRLSIAWQAAADKADLATEDVDTEEIVHVTHGDMSADDYLMQVATDLLIHTWDLGKSIGVKVNFDEAVAARVFDQTVAHKKQLADSGLFAKPVAVAADAPLQNRLLGLFGRDIAWLPE